MRKFVYTSTSLVGEAIFGFSDIDEGLVFLDVSKVDFAKDQHAVFLQNVPLVLSDAFALVAKEKDKRQLTELAEKVTFDDFWEKYDSKTLSHKKRSLGIWNKMSEAEQVKAYLFIWKYNREILKNGTAKMYAQTYLNAELWNN